MKILDVNNLTIKTSNNILVDDVNFSINKGEVFALVGQSGSGKSLTANSVLGLTKFIGNFDISGSINYTDGEKETDNLLELPESELRSIRGDKISMIFQDPMTSLNPLHRIGKQLAEAIELHQKLGKRKIQKRIEHLLDDVELSILKDRLDAFPHELSGGQRQRIMIAMALANHPDLLIADEPTTALDVTIQKEILELLKKLRAEKSLSILLITHDLTVVANIADRIAVMHNGKIVEQGEAKQILENPSHDYTKKLMASVPSGRPKPVPEPMQEVLSVEKFSVKYGIGKSIFGSTNKYFKALKNFELNLYKGQTIAVVGESGSGKSTFAKGVLKLVPSKGRIFLKHKRVSRLPEFLFRPFRRKLQVVFQDPYSSLNPRMTIADIIKEGVIAHRKHFKYHNHINITDVELDEYIAEMIEKMNLPRSYLTRYPHQLSGGEKQRVCIARALILNPDIIVLDEPTSALDLINQAEILRILKDLQSEYKISYIFISHDLRVVKSLSHYVIVLKNGKIIEQGETEKIFSNPENDYTKNLLQAAYIM
ncbi:MAG: dipeptide ABC transporter ATP-binding protein [Rickettsiales bacterium]|nr:dipeptide ABC transporter ATP-binding protein [Rickettsiales bacterium]